jgi:hypothetical protein
VVVEEAVGTEDDDVDIGQVLGLCHQAVSEALWNYQPLIKQLKFQLKRQSALALQC